MSVSRSRILALATGAAAASLGIGDAALARPEAPAAAAPAAPAAAGGASRFLGRWELDLTRMPATYGTPPKRVVYAFQDVGSGKWLTTIDITMADGDVRHMAVRYARDGSASPGEGDRVEADSAAINSPAPDVLVMGLGKSGALGSVRVYAVSADGKELTESAASVNAAGAPFVRNFHYRRIG